MISLFSKIDKLLEDYNDVFADIYNTLLFEKNLLDENYLDFGQTESIYKLDDENLREQRRDVLKRYEDTNLWVLSMGIENQTKTDRTMPFRVMSYDVGTYMGYVKNKMPVFPVITIVLNFSENKWDYGTSIHESLSIPEDLKAFVSDYKFHVFDIAFLEDSTIEKFQSDFKIVARFFKEKRLGILEDNLFKDNKDALCHVEEVLGMMKALTGDARYSFTDDLRERIKKGEPVYMCDALDNYLKEAAVEAAIKVHIQYLLKGATTVEEIMKDTGLSEAEVLEKAEAYKATRKP